MATVFDHSVLADLLSDAGGECDPAQQAPEQLPLGAGQELSPQLGGKLVDGQLSRDERFRWSAVWGVWTPTGKGEEIDLPGPLEFGPLMPEKLHPRGCWCIACWNTGLQYGEYLKAKTVRERNGF